MHKRFDVISFIDENVHVPIFIERKDEKKEEKEKRMKKKVKKVNVSVFRVIDTEVAWFRKIRCTR